MSKIETVLLTGKTHTTARGHNSRVNLELSSPSKGSHPEYRFADVEAHPTAEQLFAGAWSACFLGAIELAAAERKVKLPADLAVDIEVDLGKTGSAYFLQARLDVSLPGIGRDVALDLVHAAHEICPYSKATRGNIDVAVNLI